MKNLILLTFILGGLALSAHTPPAKFVSSKSHIKFFSSTPAEDIEANNYKSVSTIDPVSGDVVFSVPMQSFEFEKALMQKHFNQKDFLDTKSFPKAKLKGVITNLEEISFDKNGTYKASMKGEITLHGVTKQYTTHATISVTESKIEVESIFQITLADHGIAFKKGKPSTNIAKTVEVTVHTEYEK